jgi:hypothetical protein
MNKKIIALFALLTLSNAVNGASSEIRTLEDARRFFIEVMSEPEITPVVSARPAAAPVNSARMKKGISLRMAQQADCKVPCDEAKAVDKLDQHMTNLVREKQKAEAKLKQKDAQLAAARGDLQQTQVILHKTKKDLSRSGTQAARLGQKLSRAELAKREEEKIVERWKLATCGALCGSFGSTLATDNPTTVAACGTAGAVVGYSAAAAGQMAQEKYERLPYDQQLKIQEATQLIGGASFLTGMGLTYHQGGLRNAIRQPSTQAAFGVSAAAFTLGGWQEQTTKKQRKQLRAQQI